MAIAEGHRPRMVGRLREVLEVEVADTLMAYVPPVGRRDAATRAKAVQQRAEYHADVRALRLAMSLFRCDMRAAMAEVRLEVHRAMTTMTRAMFGLTVALGVYSVGIVVAVRLH